MKKIIFIILLNIILSYPSTINTNIFVTLCIPKIDYFIKIEKIPIINHKIVKMSAYNATKGQCDSTPNIMAWNDRITKHNKNKVAAVSRDLLPLLSRNTEIYFGDQNQVQKRIILDKMGRYVGKGKKRSKIRSSIDILMDSYREARKFGKKYKRIFWFGGEAELYTINVKRSVLTMREKVESIMIPGCRIMHVSKLGYVRVKGPDGQDYYISTKPPENPSLYNDGYAFTKMCMYLMSGKENEDTVFECFHRGNPFNSGFSIAAGLSEVVDFLEKIEFTGLDIDYLKTVWNFPDIFWEYLREFKWQGTLWSLPEGIMVQPYVPIHQICAKLPVGDFVETRILSLTGGPTAVATKALRMTLANTEVPWIEMAARRASSYETGMMIAKYAYAGGAGNCRGTSLVAAGKKFGIPVKGTSSHSSVLAYDSQMESFRAQFDLFGPHAVLILDTYGYVRGAQDASQVAHEMGIQRFGSRLDTDDLAFQSKVLREILEGNGFHNNVIVLSNDIDEYVRKSLKDQEAENNCDGIGTSLNPPPIGVVYKPVLMNGRNVIKLSCRQKITDPCSKNIYRLFDDNGCCKAIVATKKDEEPYTGIYHHRDKEYEKKRFSDISTIEQILVPVLQDDTRLVKMLELEELQQKIKSEAYKMWPEIQRFDNPAEFPLYLSDQLWNTKEELKKKFQIVKEG